MNNYTGIRGILWDSINFIEMWIILRFVIFHTGYKNENNKGRIYQALFVLSGNVAVVVNEYYFPKFNAVLFTQCIPLIIYGLFFLKGSAMRQTFYYMICMVLIALINTAVFVTELLIINDKNAYHIVMDNFGTRMASGLLSVIILFVGTEIYYRICRERHIRSSGLVMPEIVLWSCVVVMVVTGFVYNLLSLKQDKAIYRLMIYLLISCFIIFISEYYIHSIYEKRKKQRELELVLKEDEKLKKQYEEGRAVYELMREKRHDAKHHFAYISYLVKEREYDKIVKYIEQINN